MITYVVCDLFQSPARVLVNTVNTVGVMGKGIARDFKRIYPDMFKQYQQICEKGTLDIGNLWLYRTPQKWVLNFPTKKHWRHPSRPEYIEAGLKKFVETYHVHGITSISFPQLGCGNGELDWETQVQPLMEQYLRPLPVVTHIHVVDRNSPSAPEHRDLKTMRRWLRSEPESLPFAEVWDDLRSLVIDAPEFREPDNNKEYRVGVDDDPPGLTFQAGNEARQIPYEAIEELWQLIRQVGFVSGESLPCGLDANADHVIPVMARLPYVEPVKMAERYSEMSSGTVGLRLLPGAAPRRAQLSLLPDLDAVEPVGGSSLNELASSS